MKLDAFDTLMSVLRLGTFAAAAKDRNLTPSAVSMQMKQLEEYVGQVLFDRSGNQVRATGMARELANFMSPALLGLDSIRKRSTMEVQGTVGLGVIESMQPIVLPDTILALRERYPGVKLRLERGRSSELVSAVKAGTLDAALVAEPEAGGSVRLHWTPVLRQPMVMLTPPKARETKVAAVFRKYPWIKYDHRTVTGDMAARYLHAELGELRHSYELGSAAAIAAMVSAGLGASIVHPANATIFRAYDVRVVKLERGAPVMKFSLVRRRHDEDSRTLIALTEIISGVMGAVAAIA